MSLPINVEDVLRFMTGTTSDSGAWSVSLKQGIATIWEWDDGLAGQTQPTDQAITDASNDLTTINGQLFSEWFAENGGDITLTARKSGQEALDLTGVGATNLIRAVALVTLDEINLLRAEHSLTARTFTQMRNAIKGKINAGDVDS